MLRFIFLTFILFVLSKLNFCDEGYSEKNICTTKRFCGECIAASGQCAWCLKKVYGLNNPRCDFIQNLEDQCGTDIFYPENGIHVYSNRSLGYAGPRYDDVQIAPQAMIIKIRPKAPVTIKVYFQAQDPLIDLYYLMDFSNLKEDKRKLASIGDLLASTIRNLSTDFRMGFGSFVEPESIVPENKDLGRPCDSRNGESCPTLPYAFKNQLSLSRDSTRFATELRSVLAPSEVGLDALMQAVVCDRHLGWRMKAKKIIIFGGDTGLDFTARDEDNGGDISVSDYDTCRLNGQVYDKSPLQRRPSMRQIIRRARKESIHIIPTSSIRQAGVGNGLIKKIHEVTLRIGHIEDLSNYVASPSRPVLPYTVHRLFYGNIICARPLKVITSKVELKDDAPPGVTVSYASPCLGSDIKETRVCRGLRVGDTVSFDVTLTLDSCTSSRELSFKIYPLGIPQQLTLRLEPVCDCPCAHPRNAEIRSPKCSGGHGTLECGVCRCDSERSGQFCQCDSSILGLNKTNDSTGLSKSCRPSPIPDTMGQSGSSSTYPGPLCSGRGDCVCGVCQCWPRQNPGEVFDGEFCQCDNFLCVRHEGKVCGGEDRGTCVCGKCLCNDAWQGNACQCPSSTAPESSCTASNGRICNGVGTCDCGKCLCHAQSLYRGPTCEECPICHASCNAIQPCIQCHVLQSGPLATKSLCDRNCPVVPIIVDELIYTGGNEKLLSTCQLQDDDNRTIFYTNLLDANNNLIIKVERSKDLVVQTERQKREVATSPDPSPVKTVNERSKKAGLKERPVYALEYSNYGPGKLTVLNESITG